jgi:5-methylthioadenosine/S-adenosylhomocysteine deaminase
MRWLALMLLVAGCHEDEGTPRDLSALGDLSAFDANTEGDFSIEEDLAPRLPDLRGIDGPPEPILMPGATDHFLLKGTILTPTGPLDGELLVEGNLITCVAASCSAQAGAAGATVIRTFGVIIPGLIDAHNHGLFDIFDETDWTPTMLYTNHNSWTAEARYKQMVNAKQYLDSETKGSTIDVNCEMDKFAEVKALAAATTSILMAPGTARACYQSLARTIDTAENDLGTDKIQTSISIPAASPAAAVCANFASGKTNAYVIHVAEGTDGPALNEFQSLKNVSSGCLISSNTTIVHGTALGTPEFTDMANAGMRLVWSPKSNVFLYGSATRIDLALAAGVKVIALGPDWSLGGSINLLDELAFAAAYDDAHLGNVLTSQRLFQMVTIDAARALGVDAALGSLEVGKRADLAIVGVDPANPYDGIVSLRPSAVQLVMVDGRVLYGDAPLVAAGPATPGCDTLSVCGVSKFLCAAETTTTNQLNETWPQITTALESALSTYDAMVQPSGIAPFSPLAPLVKCP